MYKSYKDVLGHIHDFEVKYRLYKPEEGGRRSVYQGLRCDFAYARPNGKCSQIFIIHPEFERENGEIQTDTSVLIDESGTARMWIISAEMRSIHKELIEVGVKGFFMEGNRKIAECEVTKVVDLLKNPMK